MDHRESWKILSSLFSTSSSQEIFLFFVGSRGISNVFT